MREEDMGKRVLDVIAEYNEKRRSGASLFYVENKFPDVDFEEISKALESLVDGGDLEIRNYLYYPKRN
jgi:hypothetical protein